MEHAPSSVATLAVARLADTLQIAVHHLGWDYQFPRTALMRWYLYGLPFQRHLYALPLCIFLEFYWQQHLYLLLSYILSLYLTNTATPVRYAYIYYFLLILLTPLPLYATPSSYFLSYASNTNTYMPCPHHTFPRILLTSWHLLTTLLSCKASLSMWGSLTYG